MKKIKKFLFNETFDTTFYVVLILFVLSMLLFIFSPSVIKSFYNSKFSELNGQSDQIGNALSGLLAPFVAVVAAFITFLAFWVQYKWNVNQRKPATYSV